MTAPLITWPLEVSTLSGPQCFLVSPCTSVCLELVFYGFQAVWVFLVPQGTVALVKGYGSHQRRMDRRLTSKRFGIVTRSLLKGMWLAFPALKGLWVHELHKSRNWLMTYGIQWSLYFVGFRVITENGGASGDQICDWETAPLFPWVWRMSGRVQACWHQVLLWVLVTKPSTRPASTFNCWTISLAWLWFDFSRNT